jgi:hypothetical protein
MLKWIEYSFLLYKKDKRKDMALAYVLFVLNQSSCLMMKETINNMWGR